MFGSKSLSLPSPFAYDNRAQHPYSESTRPQPSGQCHFLVLHGGNTEQRCACQGYHHDRNSLGSVCDCTHAACYHAQTTRNESLASRDSVVHNVSHTHTSNLLDKIQKLEEAIQVERDSRERVLVRERQAWEREIRVLREALAPFYQNDQDMQRKLSEIDDRLDGSLKDQAQTKARVTSLENASMAHNGHGQRFNVSGPHVDQRTQPIMNGLGPNDASILYSGSEGRTSASAEPMSPRQSNHAVVEPESPRSSGILNLVEFRRPTPPPRYAMPPRLSPPAEAEEPRSSGFLGVDLKELIQRRKIAHKGAPAQAYHSPSSSSTKSPPNGTRRNTTPRSLPRVSPPNIHLNGHLTELEDRAYKKRKHHSELMALDVLANVSAASPIIS